MSTTFPAGIDLLLAAFGRGMRETGVLGRRHIEHLRATRNHSDTAAPSYTGAVEVGFSDADKMTLTAEDLGLDLVGLEGPGTVLAFHGLQRISKRAPIEAQILETALWWLRADVYGELLMAEELIAQENVSMYGTVGREEALLFKRKWLPQVRHNLN